MHTVTSHQQPTIAVITANYCEKLAVDAMMENKTTYVKFKIGGMYKLQAIYCYKKVGHTAFIHPGITL